MSKSKNTTRLGVVNVESEELRVKKIKTVSHFGKTTLPESAGILNKFGGDVLNAVEYARRLNTKETQVRTSNKDIESMLGIVKPFSDKLREKYTSEEIEEMYTNLKGQNEVAEKKFISKIVYGYMGKLQ